MTYRELDAAIRKMEPQEELIYRHVIRHPDYSILSRKTINGQEYMLLVNAVSDTFHHCPHPFVSVHKNHRFTNMPPHIHAGIEISYIYSGTCRMTLENRPYTLKKGQFLLMDSAIPHSIDSVGGMDDILISVIIVSNFLRDSVFHHLASGNILSEFLSKAISPYDSHNSFILFHSENSRRLPIFMNELMIEHLEPSLNAVDVITHLLQLIFLDLMSLYGNGDAFFSNMPSHSGTYDLIPILNYIHNNYRDCTLKSTAQSFGMSSNYLTTLLKKNTGFSFKELVQKQRFSDALNLLKNTDLSVEMIASSVGYGTTTYFYKKFRDSFGCSPKEYRLRHTAQSNEHGACRPGPLPRKKDGLQKSNSEVRLF